MRIAFLFLASLLILSNQVQSQNLVVNPSFEDGIECDNETEETTYPTDWSALAGSPRFINPNCPLTPETKTYIQGIKLPSAAEGDVFVGMGLDVEGEYLQGKLSKAMEAGKRYMVKLRVRLPVRFCFTAIDELGVVLTDSVLAVTEDYSSIDLPSLKLLSNDQGPIKSQYEWLELSALYIAKGTEDKIMIGNFKDCNVSNFKKRKESTEKKQCTYIYIDMVSVEEYKEISLKNYNSGSDLKKGDRYVLKDVEFETALDKLKGESFSSLDDLAKRLIETPTLRLEVSGHTDNTGDEATNRIFAKSRAEAVTNYLIAKGVKSNQLIAEGKGSAVNIAINNSEKNREKNRRIEIQVLQE